MKILYIKLVNFIGVHAAMGLKEIELEFDKINKPIIQIYGKNRCGKTVLIQQLHPFSSINLNGDERSDLSLILPKQIGVKKIVYDVNGEIYTITHTYQPTRSSHSITSSLIHDGVELNPSGGVNVFNTLIEKILGINKYVFQFIINGTQLTSFANMNTTQRKNLLNKAMGIDIYDKIHKLATDDYRYTNKLITSLNNTKEFILSKYSSYDNLCMLLREKQTECNNLSTQLESIKSNIAMLSGQISIIRNQNVHNELIDVNNKRSSYLNVISELGSFDNQSYDKLVNEQIDLNNSLSNLKNDRLMILKDIDILYDKKNNIENTIMASKRASNDYNNMVNLRNELCSKIDNIVPEIEVSASSSYFKSMVSLGQVINDTCVEIVSSLNQKHLKMFAEMIERGIDVSAFLIQEGSILMDTEKEKSTISRIRSMINSVNGDHVDKECVFPNCVYRKTHELLETYFRSYQSASESKFTQYDIEQLDHAYKNVQTINRLLNTEFPKELQDIFNIVSIMKNLVNNKIGIDVMYVQYLMEEAAKIEQRTQYISQLSNIEKTIENMKDLLLPIDDTDSTINSINNQINELRNKVNQIDIEINSITDRININDKHRMMLSQVQHLNPEELEKRYQQLNELNDKLIHSEQDLSLYNNQYNEINSRLTIVMNEVKLLSDSYNQYNNTVAEIEKHLSNDKKYKVIAEATSSTKGKPVIAIRDTVETALMMTNRLLDIMYDGEIEMLTPTIDESTFSLPFRCGSHTSNDIRYGSQSESTLLSLALELSLASILTHYGCPLIDEIDAYLDSYMHDSFIMMIQEMMATLKLEQLFLISHSLNPGQYDHIVYTIDISRK